MMKFICSVSGEEFKVSEKEREMYQKFGLEVPKIHPKYLYRHLLAFWQKWSIYKRQCDKTGKNIISVFGPDCPYPVWSKDEWMKSSNPPQSLFEDNINAFEQMWSLFRLSPIPHNIGEHNQNADYTDDCWYSQNCYLSHSVAECEDTHYSYRVIKLKNCQFCVYSFASELCVDLINCDGMYNVRYALNSRKCIDSSFLYDCRNCSDCYMCWNLRNKKYCIENVQYTKEEYFTKINQLHLESRSVYDQCKNIFKSIVENKAFHKCNQIEKAENSTGDYLQNVKNVTNSFFLNDAEDAIHCFRGAYLKDCVGMVSPYKLELGALSTLVQDNSYSIVLSFAITQCRFMEYCVHCFQCENCFMCCGLVGKKYSILNKEYSPEEYFQEVDRIKKIMKEQGTYGQLFPGYFAANSYEESLCALYYPLSKEDQLKNGFRVKQCFEEKNPGYMFSDAILDNSLEAKSEISQNVYWDAISQKPFQIGLFDFQFSQQQKVPLPNRHYISRIVENFSWLYFDGELRDTKCALTGMEIQTTLPAQYDGRIVSEEAYLEKII